MGKYLVTGAAGFIGRSIVGALLAEGKDVRGVDNLLTGKRSNLVGLSAMEFIHGDLIDPEVCAAACEDVDVIFHEAALGSVARSIADPVATHIHGVEATLNLLVAAQQAGVRRVVYAGSWAVYGDAPPLPTSEATPPNPSSPYAVSKLAGEHYMRVFGDVYGMETVVLRYFSVYGPYQDANSSCSGVLAVFCRQMLSGQRPTIYGDGNQSRDFTYIDDIVRGTILAAEAPAPQISGQTINLASGTRVTVNEAYRAVQQVTGLKAGPAYARAMTGDIRHSHADNELAFQVLGWQPEISLYEGLRHTVHWYQEAELMV